VCGGGVLRSATVVWRCRALCRERHRVGGGSGDAAHGLVGDRERAAALCGGCVRRGERLIQWMRSAASDDSERHQTQHAPQPLQRAV